MSRVSVAYYYLMEERGDSLEHCFGSIVFQLALQDHAYAAAVAKICETTQGLERADQIWEKLFVELLPAAESDAIYICIDGYHGDLEGTDTSTCFARAMRTAFEDRACERVRLLFTGTYHDLAMTPFGSQSYPELALGRLVFEPAPATGDRQIQYRNHDDLVAVAGRHLSSVGNKKPELKKFFDSLDFDIAAWLVTAVGGDYNNLASKIRQLDTCESEESLKEVIKGADVAVETTLTNTLTSLERTLTQDSIRQLNEILTWVIGGRIPMEPEFLQTVLYLQTGQTLMLRSMIELKFATVLAINEDDEVELVSKDLAIPLTASQVSEHGYDRFEKLGDGLHAREIELVQRMVHNLCGEEVYDRFNFQKFFDTKAGRQRVSIGTGSRDMVNLTILQRCLEVLCTRQDEPHSSLLREYAAVRWYEHCIEIEDLSEADKDNLRLVGVRLAAILSSDRAIDTWFDTTKSWRQSKDLVAGDQYDDAIIRILKNRYVASGYAGEPHTAKWISSVAGKKSQSRQLFRNVAIRLADKWIHAEEFNINYLVSSLTILEFVSEQL